MVLGISGFPAKGFLDLAELNYLPFSLEFNPIAIACFLLVTFGPFFDPLRRSPFLNSSIVLLIPGIRIPSLGEVADDW